MVAVRAGGQKQYSPAGTGKPSSAGAAASAGSRGALIGGGNPGWFSLVPQEDKVPPQALIVLGASLLWEMLLAPEARTLDQQ